MNSHPSALALFRWTSGKAKDSSKANPCNPPALKPYARGSFKTALNLISSDPAQCREHLRKRMLADTTSGPQESREKAWHELAKAAGFDDPFRLSPELILTVMGALDRAEYRSAELYLWTAKSIHIARGHEWTAQLIQAARRAKAACKRGRGPAKQAQPLPLSDLHPISDQLSPLGKNGPCHPVRSTVLVSWRLLFAKSKRASQKYITSSLNIVSRLFTGCCPQAKQTGRHWVAPELRPVLVLTA